MRRPALLLSVSCHRLVCTPRPGRRRAVAGQAGTRGLSLPSRRRGSTGQAGFAHTPRGSCERAHQPEQAGGPPGRQADTRHPSHRVSDDRQQQLRRHRHHRRRTLRNEEATSPPSNRARLTRSTPEQNDTTPPAPVELSTPVGQFTPGLKHQIATRQRGRTPILRN